MRVLRFSATVTVLASILLVPGCKSRQDDQTVSSAALASTGNAETDGRVGIALRLARGIESGLNGEGNFNYEMRVEVGNPNSTPVSFDAVEMEFTDAVGKPFTEPMFLSGQTIRFRRRSVITSFRYGDSQPSALLPEPAEDGDEPITMIVEDHQVVSFPSSIAGALRPSRPGESPTIVNVTLMLSGKPVSGVYRAMLPALMEIPDEYKVRDEEEWFRVVLQPDSGPPPILAVDQ